MNFLSYCDCSGATLRWNQTFTTIGGITDKSDDNATLLNKHNLSLLLTKITIVSRNLYETLPIHRI